MNRNIKFLCYLITGTALMMSCAAPVVRQNINSMQTRYKWSVPPNAALDRKAFEKYYSMHPERWNKAFEFLSSRDLDSLPVGRYEIDGDRLFAKVDEYTTRNVEDTRYEAHKDYADIQYMIRGEERISVQPLKGLSLTVPYSRERDISFYTSLKDCFFLADSTSYFIFFPENAHRPCLKVTDNSRVRKIVIKVKLF